MRKIRFDGSTSARTTQRNKANVNVFYAACVNNQQSSLQGPAMCKINTNALLHTNIQFHFLGTVVHLEQSPYYYY